MKLSEEDRTILFQLAKRARKEIHDGWKDAGVAGKDSSEAAGIRDSISRAALGRVKPLLKPRFTFADLLYEIGVQEGRLKDKRP